MSPEVAARLGVPALLVGFALFGLVLPVVRVWRRSGVFPVVVHRGADPFQDAMGTALFGAMAAAAAWGALLFVGGPSAAGGWVASPAMAHAGLGVGAAGLLGVVVAQFQMGDSWRIGIDDRPTSLRGAGLYRLVRNPIYSALLLALTGAVLMAPSPWSIAVWVHIATLIALQTRLEEAHMLRLHRDRYATYAARVGRFVPGLGRLAPPPR